MAIKLNRYHSIKCLNRDKSIHISLGNASIFILDFTIFSMASSISYKVNYRKSLHIVIVLRARMHNKTHNNYILYLCH